jgi:hypothetical protein
MLNHRKDMALKAPVDLFAPVVPPERMHPQFVELWRSPFHEKPRALLTDLVNRMGDPNGNFVGHFQGDGFHSRLFELASFAYLDHAGLTMDRSHAQPDFLAYSKDIAIAIEAVTANPPGGQATDISLQRVTDLSKEEILEKVSREFPRRMGKILNKKLAYNYHDLPQCKDKPLVFMMAPFFEAGSAFYTDHTLIHLLFGTPDGVNEIEPFFQKPDTQPVSAILYCNLFTVSRFLRLSMDFTLPEAPRLLREGTCYLARSDGVYALKDFLYRVGTVGAPSETWAEGVTIFENPNSRIPLPRDVLPCSSRVCIQDGHVYREVRGFHPLVSSTKIYSDGDVVTNVDGFLTRDHGVGRSPLF